MTIPFTVAGFVGGIMYFGNLDIDPTKPIFVRRPLFTPPTSTLMGHTEPRPHDRVRLLDTRVRGLGLPHRAHSGLKHLAYVAPADHEAHRGARPRVPPAHREEPGRPRRAERDEPRAGLLWYVLVRSPGKSGSNVTT